MLVFTVSQIPSHTKHPKVSSIDRPRLTVEPGIHLKSGYALAVGVQLGAFVTLDRPRCHGSRKRKYESERLEKHIANEGSE